MSVLDRTPEAGAPSAGLSHTATGRPVPLAALRVLDRLGGLGDRWWGWIGPILITALTFALRVRNLGTPHEFSFDETYYAKDAWSMLNNGFVQNYQQTVDGQKIDDAILSSHTTGIWTDGPAMIVHPEVGKWLIALGEKAFGMDPFGWRIAACVVGSLMVLVMCRLARRVTGSTLLGCVAGLLMCFDGLEFVLSRLALLDIFLAFFVLCGTACVVNDRDWHRRRLGRLIGTDPAGVEAAARGWGPIRSMLWRPWLLTGGVCFGLACGTKWDAAYPMAAFGVLVWLWSSNARRSFGVKGSLLKGALVDGVPAFLQLILVAVVVYIASWTGWMMHYGQYEAHLSATQYTQFTGTKLTAENHYTGCAGGEPGGAYEYDTDPSKHWPTRDEAPSHGIGQWERALKDLWYYHHDVYIFHTHFLNCSTHPYGSKPSGWPLVNRPVGVATDLTIQPGQDGCTAAQGSTCYRETLLIGTPVLWWGGFLALIFAAVMWVATRDWRFGVALVGALATWLPWLMYDDRPIFFFYAVAYLPFMLLAIVLAMGKLIGRSNQPSTRRTVGVIVSGSFFVLVLLNFAYFFPILTYEQIPRSAWLHRMWFSRWI